MFLATSAQDRWLYNADTAVSVHESRNVTSDIETITRWGLFCSQIDWQYGHYTIIPKRYFIYTGLIIYTLHDWYSVWLRMDCDQKVNIYI